MPVSEQGQPRRLERPDGIPIVDTPESDLLSPLLDRAQGHMEQRIGAPWAGGQVDSMEEGAGDGHTDAIELEGEAQLRDQDHVAPPPPYRETGHTSPSPPYTSMDARQASETANRR